MAPARRLRLKVAEAALSDFGGGGPIRVLDAGCGDGLLSLGLARRYPSWEVVGVDLRSDLLHGARARAQGRGIRNVKFVVGDLLRPLPVAGFDAVIALECLSEIPDDEAALRTCAATLRPGGILIAQVPDSDWRPVLRGSATTWREQVRQGYTSADLATMLEGAGLVVASLQGTYRSLAAAAQEIRDRIKGRSLPLRLLAFPFLAGAVVLEHHGLTWGRPNAILATARLTGHQT